MHDIRALRATNGPDEAIAAVASRQGGVIDRPQLEALGLDRGAISHRVATGRLRRLHLGVYAVGHEALQRRGIVTAALLAAGPGAVLSHRTAAFLQRILPSMPPYTDVTSPGRHRNRRGLVFHRGEPQARMLHGLPVTPTARTLRDLAATIPLAELERACCEALVLTLVTTAELTAETGPGSGVLRGLVADDLAPTQSALERRFRRLARDHGLPLPECQVRICAHRVDFLYRAERLAIEVDGFRFHGNRIAGERDRANDAELQLAGFAVLRFSWNQVRHQPPARRGADRARTQRSSDPYSVLIRAKISFATPCCWSRVGSATCGQRIAPP